MALLLLVAAACSGGGETDAVNGRSTASIAATALAADSECVLPALPTKPASWVDVRSFGAVPGDGRDDTAAIQTALDSLTEGQWLLFPAGTYEHSKRLIVRTPGAVLWSEGATLHATNPDDQAVMLSADGASIYNFTLTAITGSRENAPWHSRIAVFELSSRPLPLRNNVVQGNRIVPAPAPGVAGANSASSAGIYVDHADNFLIAGNEVRRSLADGIHVNGGSRNGRVVFNTVRETGDDMIGVVSYMTDGDWTAESSTQIAQTLAERLDRLGVRNVLVANNDLAGQYFGRGIAVVGGADITVRDNRVAHTTFGAGILVAREASFVSWGVNNVLVEGNTISSVQTSAPAYTPAGWGPTAPLTGHAAIEIHAFVFDDELALADLVQATVVQDVRVVNNQVTQSSTAGVRVGAGTGQSSVLKGINSRGQPLQRRYGGGLVRRVEISGLSLQDTAVPSLQILSNTTTSDNVFCETVTRNGVALSHAACGGVRPVVSGAAIACSR